MDCWVCCYVCVCVCVYKIVTLQKERLLAFFWTWMILDRLSGCPVASSKRNFSPLDENQNHHHYHNHHHHHIITFFFSSSWLLQSLVVQFYKSYSGCRTFGLTIQALCKASVSWTDGKTTMLQGGFELVIRECVLPWCTLRGWMALLAKTRCGVHNTRPLNVLLPISSSVRDMNFGSGNQTSRLNWEHFFVFCISKFISRSEDMVSWMRSASSFSLSFSQY